MYAAEQDDVSTQGARTPDALETAATLLAQALEGAEALTEALERAELDSAPRLDHAAALLDEAADRHQRVGEHLKSLVEALGRARDRQLESASRLSARGAHLRAARESHEALSERFAALGAEARELDALLAGVLARRGKSDGAAVLEALDEALAKMSGVLQPARAVSSTAKAQGFGDLEREAARLGEQLAAAQEQLEQVRARLAAPSDPSR